MTRVCCLIGMSSVQASDLLSVIVCKPWVDCHGYANRCFTVSEAIRRAKGFEEFDLAWFEESLPAEDIDGHVRLSQSTSLPIAVGESLYHPSHFREYLQRGGCSIVQVDVARIGGITRG